MGEHTAEDAHFLKRSERRTETVVSGVRSTPASLFIFMKEVKSPLPEKHVFVCVNEREAGRDCCTKVGGIEIFQKIKAFVMLNGLNSRVWVTKTKCLGFCNPVGTTIAVYPEKKIFTEVKVDDIDELLKSILDLIPDF